MSKQPLKPAVPNVATTTSLVGSGSGDGGGGQGSGDTTGRGIAFMLLCVTTGSMMDAMIKYASPTFGTAQIIFFRSLITLIPIIFMIWRSGGIEVLRSGQPWVQVIRVAFGVVAMFGFFFALGQAPFAQVVAIGFAAPMFMTAMGALFLGEVVRIRRWSAVIVGFIGVLIALDPVNTLGSFTELNWGIVAALAATVGYAASSVLLRTLSKTDTALAIMFYYLMTTLVLSGAALPFVWVTPSDWTAWLPLLFIGIAGWFVQIGMSQAFRYAEASVVAPFEYLGIIFAVVVGYLVWDEIPQLTTYIGSGIIVASGLYILHRETRLKGRSAKH